MLYVATALLRALVWTVFGLVALHVVSIRWVRLLVSCWWRHQHLRWIVWVHICLIFHRWRVHLTHVLVAFNCYLLLRSQNLFQWVLFLDTFSFLRWVLLSGRVLRWSWMFWLYIAWWYPFLLIWGRRISLRNVFRRNVTGITGLCIWHYARAIVKAFSWWCLFRNVMSWGSLDFFIFAWKDLFFFIFLAVNILLFNSLRSLCSNNASLNTFSYLMGMFDWNATEIFWNLLFIRIKFLNSFINEFSVLLKIKFCVITDWRVNYFVWCHFLFRFVEWSQIRMFQDLWGSWSFFWVYWKHWCHKI